MVLLAAPALASVLGAAQDITLSALDRADALAVLGSVVAQQAQAAAQVPAKVGNPLHPQTPCLMGPFSGGDCAGSSAAPVCRCHGVHQTSFMTLCHAGCAFGVLGIQGDYLSRVCR